VIGFRRCGSSSFSASRRRSIVSGMSFAVGIPTALAVGLARAAPPPVNLAYSAPPGCPDQAYVLRRVSSRVQHNPAVPISASVTILRRGARYQLKLTMEGGTQSIQAESCEELVDTLTVVLSFAVDPLSAVASTVTSSHAARAKSNSAELPPESPRVAVTDAQNRGTGSAPADASTATLSTSAADSPLDTTPGHIAAPGRLPRLSSQPSKRLSLPERSRKSDVSAAHRKKYQTLRLSHLQASRSRTRGPTRVGRR
jgi:hypothetical protein